MKNNTISQYKYDEKNCKRISLKMQKVDYEKLEQWLLENGKSKNGYIIELIKNNCPAFEQKE